MADCVLDASAALARLRGERGADVVEARLEAALMSAVNYAEVVSKLIDFGTSADIAADAAGALGMAVVPFDELAAVRVGSLRDGTRSRGLSIGDRACIALAERLALPVLTADRAWAELDLGIEVVLIR
ncbi:MAG: type II toxin-antitoxin system VapC family toxin [Phenylobacterium sp.]